MPFGSQPKDLSQIPISCVYVPGTGFVPLQGWTNINTDAQSNQSTGLVTAGGFTEQASLSAGALNADLVPGTDVSGYKTLSLHINTNAYSGTLSFQCSNDNTNWLSVNMSQPVFGNLVTTTSGTNLMFWCAVNFRYFRCRMTSYTSGAAQGTLELYTAPSVVNTNVNQGTTPWLIAGPTGNSAQPANTAGNVVIKGSSGWLFHAIVTTLGTVGLTIYDNASTNSGTPLLVIPASAAVGTIYSFPSGARALNGITSAGVLNCPAVTFHYS